MILDLDTISDPLHITFKVFDFANFSAGVSLLLTWLCLTNYCVFFSITGFIQRETTVRTVRKRYITSEVAANFIDILDKHSPVSLPAPCDC